MLSPLASLYRVNMYRLTLYFLLFMVGLTILFSHIDILPYNALDILANSLYLGLISHLTNAVLSKLFQVKTRPESTSITALILTLIIGPVELLSHLGFLTLISVVSIASKYLLSIRTIPLLNPAGFAVLVSAILISQSASWWVGSFPLFPFMIIGGLLIAIRTRKFPAVLTFLLAYILFSLLAGSNPLPGLPYSPLIFFATIMLTEPRTSPVVPRQQLFYATFTALAIVLLGKYLSVGYTLELALVLGNLFFYWLNHYAPNMARN